MIIFPVPAVDDDEDEDEEALCEVQRFERRRVLMTHSDDKRVFTLLRFQSLMSDYFTRHSAPDE